MRVRTTFTLLFGLCMVLVFFHHPAVAGQKTATQFDRPDKTGNFYHIEEIPPTTPPEMAPYGTLIEFQVTDIAGNERNIQVFVPKNYDPLVPTKVMWYFRGTNGINITYNIETTRLYKTAFEEKIIVVAPNLFEKTWSKGTVETDYYLVHDLIEMLATLKDKDGQVLNLDLEHMVAAGFSGGAGWVYHISGHYPLIFREIPFKRYQAHSKMLIVDNSYDVQSVSDLRAMIRNFPNDLPLFLISIGSEDPIIPINEVFNTKNLLVSIGLDAVYHEFSGLNHRYLMGFSADFNQTVKNFLFPLHVVNPGKNADWVLYPGSTFEIKWTSHLVKKYTINIDLFSVDENRWYALAGEVSDTGSYTLNVDNFQLPAGRYVIRLETTNKRDVAYSELFNFSDPPVNVEISGQRVVEKTWLFTRHYAKILITTENADTCGVSGFLVYRKTTGSSYQSIIEIPFSDFQDNSYTFYDKFIEKNVNYTYQVAAVNANGKQLALSDEKHI